jgi:sialate O-acetylesterase
MKKVILLVVALLSNSWIWAEMRLPALFSDGMVLQQKAELPVWGWGTPGDPVEVRFGRQVQTTKVDADGKWMVKLKPETASTKPAKMTIRVGAQTQEITNILVGEVWICSGQSNMDFTFGRICSIALRTPENKPIVEYMKKELNSASDSLFRQIAVPHQLSVREGKDDFKGQWIKSSPENNGAFTAVGYFFGRELRKELNVPVGLIKSAWGGTRVEPWVPAQTYRQTPTLQAYYETEMANLDKQLKKWNSEKANADYKVALAKWKKKTEGMKKKPRNPRRASNPENNKQLPTCLYNGMICPLVPYAMKGAIWYQGESNERYSKNEYAERFMATIKGWRTAWKQGDFPFYYVQLASYRSPRTEPTESPWAFICNQQRLTLKLKNTGMAVINDIGEARDIHPKNKVDTGKRLALWTLAKDYGHTNLVYSGPLYQNYSINGSTVTITFSSVGDGLMTGKKNLLDPVVETKASLGGFQICGADKKWYWGNAKIVGKNKVEVSCPDVKKPIIVRYAWADNPTNANLYNKAGLPTSAFTTETL